MPADRPDEITLWPAVRQAAAIRHGDITSRALLERYLERIERIDAALNAVVTRDFDGARARADAADAAAAKGEWMGPLHGVPVTIKDALETEGIRSTGGAAELRDYVPGRDAPVVRAIRDAGAIVMGKTNLPRWSGDVQSYNELFGATNNPWDLGRTPGGSSGGAAAAVAAGLSAFEIGTDIGGSIRIPSAYCGVFGHKPSFGVVPSSGYLDHADGGSTEADVNVLGPIARAAGDLELLLGLLLRKQGPLVASLAPPPADVRALRVAAWLDDPFCPIDGEQRELFARAVHALQATGVAVDMHARPGMDADAAARIGMWLVSAAMLESQPGEAAEGRAGGRRRYVVDHREWLAAHRAREAIRAQWAAFFEHYDAVLMPVTFVPSFAHDHHGGFGDRVLHCDGHARPYADIVRWTTLVGMAYLPATVPPIGCIESGVPAAFQVVGPYGSDYRTIRLAAHISRACGGFKPPPLSM